MQTINKPMPVKYCSVNQPKLKPKSSSRKRRSLLNLLRHKEMLLALGSGMVMLAGWGAGYWSLTISVILYIVAYIVGGYMKAMEGLMTLFKDRSLDVNLLMIAAAIGAASIGYWNEGAILIFIFALSGALESYATDQSRKDISALISLKPETALKVVAEHRVMLVPVEQLELNDVVLIKPGELIPTDGIIRDGASSIDQATITGESIPVDKSEGDEVFAGTINGEGAIYVTVTSRAEGSLFSKIVAMVEQAEKETPASERFIKRLEGHYAKGVVLITIGIIVLTPLLLNWTWTYALYKAMVFLVVASPCAIVSSVMPAVLSAMSNSARKGVLFKGGSYIDHLGHIKVAAFDKTGTLTRGEPVVTQLYAASGYDRHDVLTACASVESLSQHPLARAIVRKAEGEGLQLRKAEQLQALPGWGIEAMVDGALWRIGKADENDPKLPPELARRIAELAHEGNTISVIQCNGEYAAIIGLKDQVRPEAKTAIRKLHDMGIVTVMLTGDRRETAEAIAQDAGIDRIYSDLLPGDKVKYIQELQSSVGGTIMIGDGVNDAPALAAATVGIAMGSGGSGAALEVADVVLTNDKLEKIAETVQLARKTTTIIRQNLCFAGVVIFMLIVGNFVQELPLPIGVIGHEGSTILVIVNGLRLLRFTKI